MGRHATNAKAQPQPTNDRITATARDAGGLHCGYAAQLSQVASGGGVFSPGASPTWRLRDRGANVVITWGTANARGIAIFALVVFVTGLPLAYYAAARYNIDLILILTRGSGFG